jgi:hypothetical protein
MQQMFACFAPFFLNFPSSDFLNFCLFNTLRAMVSHQQKNDNSVAYLNADS